jgi:hypothetical protein
MADPLVELFIKGIGSGQNRDVNHIENRPIPGQK